MRPFQFSRKEIRQSVSHHIRLVFPNLTGGYNLGRMWTVNQGTRVVDCAIQLPWTCTQGNGYQAYLIPERQRPAFLHKSDSNHYYPPFNRQLLMYNDFNPRHTLYKQTCRSYAIGSSPNHYSNILRYDCQLCIGELDESHFCIPTMLFQKPVKPISIALDRTLFAKRPRPRHSYALHIKSIPSMKPNFVCLILPRGKVRNTVMSMRVTNAKLILMQMKSM